MKKLTFFFFLFVFGRASGLSADTLLVKQAYAGGYIVLPSTNLWKLEQAFISSGDGYNVMVSLKSFKGVYHEGDTVKLPYYISEMELLTDKSMVSYLLKFKKTESK